MELLLGPPPITAYPIIISRTIDNDTTISSGGLFENYADSLLKFASVMCMIFALIGIPGNLITIIALARCKKVRNATALFVINLSCSDLLFCCFNLPLAASTFWQRDWTHGDILCELFPLARYGLLAVSLFTILAITINRYVMIVHPRIYPRIYRRKFLALMIAGTWTLSFCALIPTWMGAWGRFGLDVSIGSCTILRDANGNSPKEFLFSVAFALPCIFIVMCYARIFFIVRKAAVQSHGGADARKDSVRSRGSRRRNSRRKPAHPEPLPQNGAEPFVKFDNPEIRFMDSTSIGSGQEAAENGQVAPQADEDSDACSVKEERVQNHAAQSHLENNNTSNASILYRGRMTVRDKRLLKMILVIFSAFLICYLPITITKIFKGATEIHGFNISGYLLIYMTTCINPIIYAVMSSEYRRAYWGLIMCDRQQQNSA
ncbi:G-protein coupled receptor moody [Phlebotomus argentipes]|uniref:G-protein coupled receptor moody n=1 Tax=Phlebotomus argentipes TaxID=94469 RepID=UPI002892EE5C|nr:G-protein coupled receptor moody [Phlebotomus argentipes]